MILNLGSGEVVIPGSLRVDLRADCADIHCDVRDLPMAQETVDEIYAYDILEHFWDQDAVITEWSRVLRPGGRMHLRVPNLQAIAAQIAYWASDPNGEDRCEALILNIYGGHRWGPDGAWDTHHWGYTPSTLARFLHRHGYQILEQDEALNMTVTAAKA